MSQNRICQLFGIDYPIIQAGMIWCSGWKLAAAVSEAGGLGIIGSGSMYPDVLDRHLHKIKARLGTKPFAVNLPMLYPQIEDHLQLIADHAVPIVFTSAGNPAKYTAWFKARGICVVHVVSSLKFALKAQAAGVDAVVAEGFEAGGHNGRDETTTMTLIPMVARAMSIPLIAAGGIASGAQILAARALGADAVQIGSRFVATEESSAHPAFKQAVLQAQEGDTVLTLKELAPVRLLKNPFFDQVQAAYLRGADREELRQILGRARAKRGMFEGDLGEGELEIGQVSGMIDTIRPAGDLVRQLWQEYREAKAQLTQGED